MARCHSGPDADRGENKRKSRPLCLREAAYLGVDAQAISRRGEPMLGCQLLRSV